MVGSESVYCGEQGRGGGDNVEAFRFSPGDAPLTVRDCSRRVFCAGMLTGALASVMSLDGCAARRNEAGGSAVPAKQKANHPSAQKTEALGYAAYRGNRSARSGLATARGCLLNLACIRTRLAELGIILQEALPLAAPVMLRLFCGDWRRGQSRRPSCASERADICWRRKTRAVLLKAFPTAFWSHTKRAAWRMLSTMPQSSMPSALTCWQSSPKTSNANRP